MQKTAISPRNYGEPRAVAGQNGLENIAHVEDAGSGALPVDPALQKRVDRALCGTGYLPLRKVYVLAARGLVVLRGAVPTYHMKQLAQATAIGVPGVIKVCNELEIISRRKPTRHDQETAVARSPNFTY
jgi:osmotically-inducible protein OsmY